MDRKLLKTVQTITTYRNRLADPVGTRRGPPLVRGPQFENRWAPTPVHPLRLRLRHDEQICAYTLRVLHHGLYFVTLYLLW